QWETRNFYNDSNSTTQEATLAALIAFPAASIVLIFGGADKGLPIDHMIKHIADNNIRGVLIEGTGSDRVFEKLPHLKTVGTMHDAVKTAIEISQPNDNIVLSPAFASFGVFKNEYDRSDQFMLEVQNLIEGRATCSR
ncbi:MAG: UDP-N-acetylmuramoyl-L-alanine--D-glutamate ligase, partial [Alphaproteobacteria bacterium]